MLSANTVFLKKPAKNKKPLYLKGISLNLGNLYICGRNYCDLTIRWNTDFC